MPEKKELLELSTGDWRNDPRLSMCSPATRGVWIDALAVMHDSDRSGALTGTLDQLARVLRCTPSDIQIAITELISTGAADVRENNGLVTLINRRMKREYEQRKKNAEKQKNQRLGGKSRNGDLQEDNYALRWRNHNVTHKVVRMSQASCSSEDGDMMMTSEETERVQGSGEHSFSPHTPLNTNIIHNINNTLGEKGDTRGKNPLLISKSKSLTDPPCELQITDEMRQWADSIGAKEIQQETEKCLDYFRGKGIQRKDWQATWRNWMRNAIKFNQAETAKSAGKPADTGKYDHLYK